MSTVLNNKPKVTGNITQHAMLVSLNIRTWAATKFDKKVSHEVATTHGASDDMGRYSKRLVAKEALKEINQIQSQARAEHYRRTAPWSKNADIIKSTGYLDYARIMREFEDKLDLAANKFAQNYPDYYQDAKAQLGTLFNADDYPDPSKIREKFGLGVNVMPIPSAEDFRVEMADYEFQKICDQIEKTKQDALANAMRDVFKRLHEVVKHMVERLELYEVKVENNKVKKANPFRDSVVDNIRELIELMPSLNITNDPTVDQFIQEVKDRLCKNDADSLRDSDTTREDTLAAANEILSRLDAYI